MEFLIKCAGWITLVVGTIIAVLLFRKMEKEKRGNE